jgi:hypothetical protein
MSASTFIPCADRANRAVGAMFFSVFGCAWIVFWAINSFPGNWALVAAIVVAGLAILLQSVATFRKNKPLVTDRSADSKKRARYFHLINSGQWIAVFIVANVLINAGKPEWVLMAIITIVGLHFLPMARLFRYTPHAVLGMAMIGWAVCYSLIAGPGNAIGCLGTGLLLWGGSMYALIRRSNT